MVTATFTCVRCSRALKLAERHPSGRCLDCQKKLDASSLESIQKIKATMEPKRVARRKKAKYRRSSTRPCFVYRLYDGRGALLYVGIANNVHQRFYGPFKTAHSVHKPWWSEVVTVRVEKFLTRGDAEEAERWAIHYENPVHNISRVMPKRKAEPKSLSSVTGLLLDF